MHGADLRGRLPRPAGGRAWRNQSAASELGDGATPQQAESLVDGLREQDYANEPVDRQTAIRIVQFRVIEEVFDQFEVRLETGAACEYAPPR